MEPAGIVDVEALRMRLTGFFTGLDRELLALMETHEADLAALFSGLSPAVDIAIRAQGELDRIAATRFSVFDYFHERETDLSRIELLITRQIAAILEWRRSARIAMAEHPRCRVLLTLRDSVVECENRFR